MDEAKDNSLNYNEFRDVIINTLMSKVSEKMQSEREVVSTSLFSMEHDVIDNNEDIENTK